MDTVSLAIFDNFCNDQSTQEKPQSFNRCCNNETIVIGSNRTCLECGKSTISLITIVQSKSARLRRTSVYKRLEYFKHLLSLMTYSKQSLPKRYREAVEFLQSQEFDHIQELRHILKKNNYPKLYPYIYMLFYEVKKRHAINLPKRYINIFCQDFIKSEVRFNQARTRNNFYSYNVFIYALFQKYNLQNKEQLIIPKSKRQLLEKINFLIL